MQTKKPIQSKTIWVNVLILISTILSSPALANIINMQSTVMVSVVAIVGIILRFVTNTGISSNAKEDDEMLQSDDDYISKF